MKRAWACAILWSCSSPSPSAHAPLTQNTSVPALARVGADEIEPQLLRGVVRSQGLEPKLALDAVVRDSLLAQAGATEQELARMHARQVLARQLLLELRAQAAQAPISDSELEQFTRKHWWEMDRPAAARVTHAVVVCAACPQTPAAQVLAQRLEQAVRTTDSIEAFKSAVQAVDATGLEVKVEDLPFVTADGRIIEFNKAPDAQGEFGRLHEEFARAANALSKAGELSSVVQSPSGFHVLRLTELLPERRLSKEERERLLRPEIVSARAKQLQQTQLEAARRSWPVEVSRSFAQDTEALVRTPP